MEKNLERQVIFNQLRSKTNSERCEWWFLIINQNREIEEIQQKIYRLFMPIEEEGCKLEGIIKGTGLRYRMINFESRKKVELSELRRIYKKIITDPRLCYRKDKNGLEKYIGNVIDALED